MQGALYFSEGELEQDEELEVKIFITNYELNEEKIRSVISKEIVQHTTTKIRPILNKVSTNKAWWMHSIKGYLLYSVVSRYF